MLGFWTKSVPERREEIGQPKDSMKISDEFWFGTLFGAGCMLALVIVVMFVLS